MFGNAIEVASLFGTLELRDTATNNLRQFDAQLETTASRLTSIGGSLTRFGGQLTAMMAPIGLALGAATNQAMEFEEAMTNAFSVMGVAPGSDRWVDLSSTIQDIGKNAREGPQAVANAFYDIVGGVTDASTHMAILQQAIATSEGGAADLGATTSALISVMNSYNYSAEQSAMVSDVLTRTVGVGVGTMNEFAAALPNVVGLAAQLGISFQDVGTATAFLTTKGFSAAQSTDYLRGAMIALINPNDAMKDALAAIGAESGSAAIEMWGLAGTYGRLQRAMGSTDALANAVGRVEALQAVMALNQPQFESFIDTFERGVEGATGAARAIQQTSAAFQFDVLRSQLSSLAIEIGDALLPGINELVRQVIPIIQHVQEWISANPQLAATITAVAAAAVIAGPAIAAIGFAITGIGAVIGLATGPIGILVAALGALALAYESNFLGIKDTVQNFLSNAESNFALVKFYAEYYLGAIWDKVRPIWETLRDWFTDELAPALSDTFNNHVMPLIKRFQDFLGGIWEIVGPHLERLFNWFVNDGLPSILSFITDKVVPQFNAFFDMIGGVWDFISPGLKKFADWFLNSGLPWIAARVEEFVATIRGLADAINDLGLFQTTRTPMGAMPATGGSAFDKPMVSKTSSVLGGSGTPFVNAGTAFSRGGGGTVAYRASGGPVSGGSPYIVGERGPELFVPGGSGAIVPNGRMGGVTIGNININGDQSGRSAADYREMFVQMLEEIAG